MQTLFYTVFQKNAPNLFEIVRIDFEDI